MSEIYHSSLEICKRHAKRLQWAMNRLQDKFPLNAVTLSGLSDEEIAVLDQFTSRFAKLQDAMGTRLFPAILELTKEQEELPAFLDKLNRLEKIGAIPSIDTWLLLREIRNHFSHDYPDDPELQAAALNKAYNLAGILLSILNGIELFAENYV